MPTGAIRGTIKARYKPLRPLNWALRTRCGSWIRHEALNSSGTCLDINYNEWSKRPNPNYRWVNSSSGWFYTAVGFELSNIPNLKTPMAFQYRHINYYANFNPQWAWASLLMDKHCFVPNNFIHAKHLNQMRLTITSTSLCMRNRWFIGHFVSGGCTSGFIILLWGKNAMKFECIILSFIRLFKHTGNSFKMPIYAWLYPCDVPFIT